MFGFLICKLCKSCTNAYEMHTSLGSRTQFIKISFMYENCHTLTLWYCLHPGASYMGTAGAGWKQFISVFLLHNMHQKMFVLNLFYLFRYDKGKSSGRSVKCWIAETKDRSSESAGDARARSRPAAAQPRHSRGHPTSARTRIFSTVQIVKITVIKCYDTTYFV